MSSLSDKDKEVLAQMEREFTKEDPKFAQTLAEDHTGNFSTRRMVLSVLGMFVGIAIIIGAIIANLMPVALLGFAGMIASGMFGFTKGKLSNSPNSTTPKKKQGNFMKNLEDKWEIRRERENNQ